MDLAISQHQTKYVQSLLGEFASYIKDPLDTSGRTGRKKGGPHLVIRTMDFSRPQWEFDDSDSDFRISSTWNPKKEKEGGRGGRSEGPDRKNTLFRS